MNHSATTNGHDILWNVYRNDPCFHSLLWVEAKLVGVKLCCTRYMERLYFCWDFMFHQIVALNALLSVLLGSKDLLYISMVWIVKAPVLTVDVLASLCRKRMENQHMEGDEVFVSMCYLSIRRNHWHQVVTLPRLRFFETVIFWHLYISSVITLGKNDKYSRLGMPHFHCAFEVKNSMPWAKRLQRSMSFGLIHGTWNPGRKFYVCCPTRFA